MMDFFDGPEPLPVPVFAEVYLLQQGQEAKQLELRDQTSGLRLIGNYFNFRVSEETLSFPRRRFTLRTMTWSLPARNRLPY